MPDIEYFFREQMDIFRESESVFDFPMLKGPTYFVEKNILREGENIGGGNTFGKRTEILLIRSRA